MLAGAIYATGNSDKVLCTKNIQHIYQLPDQVIEKFHLAH